MKAVFLRLWKDEQAQATIEYILMMLVAVAMVILLIKQIIQPVMALLKNVVASRLEKAIFGGDGFHHLNVGGSR